MNFLIRKSLVVKSAGILGNAGSEKKVTNCFKVCFVFARYFRDSFRFSLIKVMKLYGIETASIQLLGKLVRFLEQESTVTYKRSVF